MVALLLALKQVLQGHHFLVMQDKKVALLWRLSCRNDTQECERTSYVPRTSGRYILEETTNVIYVQSKARHTFNNSPLEVVIMLEQTLKTNWAVHYVLLEISAIKHFDQNKDSDAVTYAFSVWFLSVLLINHVECWRHVLTAHLLLTAEKKLALTKAYKFMLKAEKLFWTLKGSHIVSYTNKINCLELILWFFISGFKAVSWNIWECGTWRSNFLWNSG